jgi:CRP/FNR family cyclic AMP-dependent transcriptional regulator
MIERFEGVSGKPRLTEALLTQKLVVGQQRLAEELSEAVTLSQVEPGVTIIEEGASDDDVYFIIAGAFDIVVRGRVVARRFAGNHVGEMAAIEPTQPRSATVVSAELSVIGRLSRPAFMSLAELYPQLWRGIAKELSRRLVQRNDLLTRVRERPRIFIMSSTEALPIARAVQLGFEYDPYTVEVWTDGVFRASAYPLEDLERELDESDFAIAVASADDIVQTRGAPWPAPRDNVTFELGFFMGHLGRKRTILLEPREEGVKLPSDLAGMTTLPYVWEPGRDQAARLAPTISKLRAIFEDLGARV